MPTTYRRVEPEVLKRAKRLMEQWHADLMNAGVTVGILYADPELDEAGSPVGPAIKVAGYAAAAAIKITGLKDRVLGVEDAVMRIDSVEWNQMELSEQQATLDHELMHLRLVIDKYGKPQFDDISRPKLKIRLHDHQFGFFDAVAGRHQEASYEVKAVHHFIEKRGQLYFPFGRVIEPAKPEGGDVRPLRRQPPQATT